MLDFPCHGRCRLLIIILVENLFHVSGAADVTLTCPETGFENGQVVEVTCQISGQKAHSYVCPPGTSTKHSTDNLNERAVRFEFLNRQAVLSMSDSFAGWEGVHLLVDGASCGPAVKWNNSVRCSQYAASGPASTYTYKFTVDSTRHRGAGLRCVVGCTHNPRRHSDVTIAYDTCNPLQFSGTPMDDLDDEDYDDDDDDDDDDEDDDQDDPDDDSGGKNNTGIPPGDNDKKPKPGASKAGVIIGGIVGVIVFVGLVAFFVSRKTKVDSPGRDKSPKAKAIPGSSKNEEKPHSNVIDNHGAPSQGKETHEVINKPGVQPGESHEEVNKSGEHPGESHEEISSQESGSDSH